MTEVEHEADVVVSGGGVAVRLPKRVFVDGPDVNFLRGTHNQVAKPRLRRVQGSDFRFRFDPQGDTEALDFLDGSFGVPLPPDVAAALGAKPGTTLKVKAVSASGDFDLVITKS